MISRSISFVSPIIVSLQNIFFDLYSKSKFVAALFFTFSIISFTSNFSLFLTSTDSSSIASTESVIYSGSPIINTNVCISILDDIEKTAVGSVAIGLLRGGVRLFGLGGGKVTKRKRRRGKKSKRKHKKVKTRRRKRKLRKRTRKY